MKGHPLATPWRPTISPDCGKRSFESVDAARRAHKHAGFRLRTYRCDLCGDLDELLALAKRRLAATRR